MVEGDHHERNFDPHDLLPEDISSMDETLIMEIAEHLLHIGSVKAKSNCHAQAVQYFQKGLKVVGYLPQTGGSNQ